MKRLTAILLTLAMVFMMPCTTVFAEDLQIHNLSDLQTAISNAEDGDTIYLTNTININESGTIGDPDKHITLAVAPGSAIPILIELYGGESVYNAFQNVTIKGGAIFQNCKESVNYDNVTFEDCTYSALRVGSGTAWITECTFTGNTGENGGAIFVDDGKTAFINTCTFTENAATGKGGAIYCGSSANCQVSSSTFTGNTAHSFGGAIYSESMCVSDCSMNDNSSVDAGGGAIYSLKNLEVINSCIYGNLPYDLFAGESVILDYADIEETYKDTDYDVKKWYKDSGTLFDAETDQPTYCLKFGYKDPTPPQEPETPSEPEQPTEPQVIYKTEYVYVPYTVTKTKEVEKEVIVEKVVGGVTATIGAASLKDAKMDSAIIPGYIEYVQRFVQPTSTMTRGEFANILYGLLTEESRNKIAAGAKDCFTDMADSPYKNVVNTLATVGFFTGTDGKFNPDKNITYGQMLNVLTKFVEKKSAYVGSFTQEYAITAVAYGWIEDVPINLDAPLTYGAFVNLLNKIK